MVYHSLIYNGLVCKHDKAELQHTPNPLNSNCNLTLEKETSILSNQTGKYIISQVNSQQFMHEAYQQVSHVNLIL